MTEAKTPELMIVLISLVVWSAPPASDHPLTQMGQREGAADWTDFDNERSIVLVAYPISGRDSLD